MLKTKHASNSGFALIEAMITLVIVVFGLLGLVGLQNRMLLAEMESYQRSQAIVIANDMAQRIMANPKGSPCYAGVTVGSGVTTVPTCDVSKITGTSSTVNAAVVAQATADMAFWHNTLLGAAEKEASSTNKVGAMIDARGCIADLGVTGNVELLVTIAWQGLSETVATPVSCGSGQYKLPGSTTATDAARRTLSVAVRAAKLD
jgi:type IV pilus assembly protein PilV